KQPIAREILIFLSFCPPLLFFTTCHSRKADSTITSQKTTVFTVEFTGTPLKPLRKHTRPQLIRCRTGPPGIKLEYVPGSTHVLNTIGRRTEKIGAIVGPNSRPQHILPVSAANPSPKNNFPPPDLAHLPYAPKSTH